MLNFTIFDITGTRLGSFKIVAGKAEPYGEPVLPPNIVRHLQDTWNRGGETELRRYTRSLEAYNSGFVFKETLGGGL